MDSQTFDYWLGQGGYIPQPQHQHHEHIYDLTSDASLHSSLNGSPVSSSFDPTYTSSTASLYHAPYSGHHQPHFTEDSFRPYGGYATHDALPMTPVASELGSPDEGAGSCSPAASSALPYRSPRSFNEMAFPPLPPLSHAPPGMVQGERVVGEQLGSVHRGGAVGGPAGPGRTHTTSGRRRAQNRAAQRAFRERKERHARDLEAQLAALTEKHRTLELSHQQLEEAYEKLRGVVEVLLKAGEGDDEGDEGLTEREKERLRSMVGVLAGVVGKG